LFLKELQVMNINVLTLLTCSLLLYSCIDSNVYKGESPQNPGGENPDGPSDSYVPYLYPFGNEIQNATVEIVIEASEVIDLTKVDVEIPPLKYNKSWLFLLAQDDCMHAAYSRTWAAINGKPVSGSTIINDGERNLYYDAAQLYAGDLPPGSYLIGKTLGATDGAGNEVRFHITTTLAPEWIWMHAETSVNKGFTENYYRFYMKSGLIWNNVWEMLNYGTGIAFHDVNTEFVNDADTIAKHYAIAQDSILRNLNGRGCKMLAEPNGNKTYVTAAEKYESIQTLTAQNGAVKFYPFQVKDDLTGSLLERAFWQEEELRRNISAVMSQEKEERRAVAVGVHGTGRDWTTFLTWLSNTYGKDGDDSVWFPNQEEYYEYNYYRIHSDIKKEISGNTIKITLSLPSGQYFYYPAITVNVKGLDKSLIRSVKTNDVVAGMSYGSYEKGSMINIDCRKFLSEHAEHYVNKYEVNKSESNLADAYYFVNMLKESERKQTLLERLK